jgi:hypothetical protein
MPALSEMDLASREPGECSRAPRSASDPHAGRTRPHRIRVGAAGGGRNPVSDFAYARAWAAGLDGTQRLHVLTAGNADDALAIAPLVINRGGAGWLTLLASEMYEILDFPGADEAPSPN